MVARVKEDTPHRLLIDMAVALVQSSEDHPRQRRTRPRGRPHTDHDGHLAALIPIALLAGRRTKAGQYRSLDARRDWLTRRLVMPGFPVASTYAARYTTAWRRLSRAVVAQGVLALEEHVADARHVAADKTLFAARGRPWSKHDRQRGRRPPGRYPCDTQAAWGYSGRHGGVWGYSMETVVTATDDGSVLPLIVSVGTAGRSEHRSFADKIPRLPHATRAVLADSGYDNNRFAECIEPTSGRRFLRPPPPRAHRTEPGRSVHRDQRERRRQRRWARYRFYQSDAGQRLDARRAKSVEPWHAWFKRLFDVQHRVRHRGLDHNRTRPIACVFLYPLLLRDNHRNGQRNAKPQTILDNR